MENTNEKKLKMTLSSAKIKEVFLFYCKNFEPGVPRMFKPLIDHLKNKKIKIHVLDVGKDCILASKMKILATPTLIIKNHKLEKRFIGEIPSEILKKIS